MDLFGVSSVSLFASSRAFFASSSVFLSKAVLFSVAVLDSITSATGFTPVSTILLPNMSSPVRLSSSSWACSRRALESSSTCFMSLSCCSLLRVASLSNLIYSASSLAFSCFLAISCLMGSVCAFLIFSLRIFFFAESAVR